MSNDDLPRSHAEETDETKLGQTVGQPDRSGDLFPPEEPLGIDDPNVLADGSIAADDVATRADRERAEVDLEGGVPERLGHDLLDPSDDPDVLDDEAELIAVEGEDADDDAEVTAMHVTFDDSR